MNANAKAWIEELRSDKYKHGTCKLVRLDTCGNEFHCCLGVACELYSKQNPDKLKRQINNGYTTIPVFVENSTNYVYSEYLPRIVQKWLGLTSDRGRVMADGTLTSLAGQNDFVFRNLGEAADFIEKHQNQLFVEENSIEHA